MLCAAKCLPKGMAHPIVVAMKRSRPTFFVSYLANVLLGSLLLRRAR